MSRYADTIAALATPVGTAALAVIRATGPDTLRLADEILRRAPLPRHARHSDYHDRAGLLLDDVVVTFFRGPQSYTGEDSLEISCHGNPFIAQKILEDLFHRGCRPAEPGEFTQRAFLNGRMDLSQAEAVMDLIHARSERALTAANEQLRGALGRRMGELIDSLLKVLARIEAYIDFPDEDLPPEDRALVLAEVDRLSEETSRLIATTHYGRLLRDGIRTVIVGKPNVGKSSLLNRLVGHERAIVSPEPGTTRDFIEERVVIGPHCLRFIDTAGLNPSPSPLEKLGMEKTHERLVEAELVLVVLDASDEILSVPKSLQLTTFIDKAVIVLNKSDLCNGSSLELARESLKSSISVSALTGEGISSLLEEIVKRADRFRTVVGPEVVAINARHSHALSEAMESLSAARQKLNASTAAELVASDLRAVLSDYGEVTGKVDNERMLDHLFATFCIGK